MVFVFGDCELDTRQGEIRRRGVPRHVEPQVFAVLRYLVEHRDRLVSKEELLDHVWQRRFVTPATLNSRLKAARQAIGDDGKDQQVIRTVRGRGFRFVAPVDERPAPGPVAAAVTSSPPAVLPEPVLAPTPPELIARSAELDRLTVLLDAARNGERQLALITGEPGIGKSTLAEAFLARVPRGFRTARGQCLEQRGTGEPYLPVLDALGRLCRGPGGDEVVRHLLACAPTWMLQMPSLLSADQLEAVQRRAYGATRERMLREGVEVLEGLARDTPVALLLEDLHWSDPSTLDFLVWLIGRRESARLLVLGTLRHSDADAGLRAAIAQVRRTGRCTELSLERWSEADVRDYWGLRHRERPLSEELVRLVHQRTDGNPLFVQTLLTAWIESGDLVESDSDWRPKGELEQLAAEIPETLLALVDRRVEQLSSEDQRILEAGSVAGPTFAAALVSTCLEIEEEEVDSRCQALARRGEMLREAGRAEWPDGTETSRYSFAHHLFREALYRRMPLSRRTRLHLKIGKRLEAAYGGDPAAPASELALHFRLGRDDLRTVRYLQLSAEQALRRSAHREALDQLASALDLIRRRPDLPDAARLELGLQRMLGPALLLTRGWGDPDAERAFTRACELSQQLDDPAQLAQALHGMAYLHEFRGDFHRSQSLLEQCLELKQRVQGPYTSIESNEMLSCSLFHQGKFGGALQNATAAMEAFQPLQWGDPFAASLGMNAAVASHYWAGLSLWCLGLPDQALEPLRSALRIAADSRLIYMQAASHGQAAQLFQFRRELGPLVEHADAALSIAERQGYPFHQAIAHTLLGWASVAEGRVSQGLDQIQRGLDMQEATGADIERPYGLGLLADALLRAGRATEGLAVVDEALATIERRARAFFWESELHRLRGELLLQEGAVEAAEASLQEALTVASRQGARSLELRAATSLCHLTYQRGPGDGVRERLRTVYDLFTEGRDTPDLREAAAILAAH